MNNRKTNPIRAIAKLFQSTGRSQAIEQNLKAAAAAEAHYTAVPMPRI